MDNPDYFLIGGFHQTTLVVLQSFLVVDSQAFQIDILWVSLVVACPVFLEIAHVVFPVVPPRHECPFGFSFEPPGRCVLDQSIAIINQSVLQLLMTQQTANTQLQIQRWLNQAAQPVHTDALRALAESTQERNFARIPIFDSTIKRMFSYWSKSWKPLAYKVGRTFTLNSW